MATNVSGARLPGLDPEHQENDGCGQDAEDDDHDVGAGLGPEPHPGEGDHEEDDQRHDATQRCDRGQVYEQCEEQDEERGDTHAHGAPESSRMGELRRELSAAGKGRGQADHSVDIGIHRGEGGEEGGDCHHGEPGISEDRSCRLGQGGLSVADHLVDGERPEHSQGDQDVEGGRDPEGDIGGLGQVAGRIRAGPRRHS